MLEEMIFPATSYTDFKEAILQRAATKAWVMEVRAILTPKLVAVHWGRKWWIAADFPRSQPLQHWESAIASSCIS